MCAESQPACSTRNPKAITFIFGSTKRGQTLTNGEIRIRMAPSHNGHIYAPSPQGHFIWPSRYLVASCMSETRNDLAECER